MFFPSIWTDATKTATALYQAGLDNMRTTQEAMQRQVEIASKIENPWQVKWTKSQVPVPYLTFQAKDMESSRETFHLMANANLTAWENTAKAYGAMPEWAKVAYKAPGDFWAKWFDQFQEGKFDAPFPTKPYSVFDTILSRADTVEEAANETEAPATEAAMAATVTTPEEFKLESPSTDAMPKLLKKAKGKADDLTQIKGIGPKLQTTLNELGVFHFAQIAAWTPENIGWLDDKLTFKGRIYREAWVEQAQNILKAAA